MRKWTVLLVMVVFIIEYVVYAWVGQRIGVGKTIFLTLATSILGGLMVQFEGRKVLESARGQMNNGQLPGRTVVDGLCILIGGLLLLIPGFVTDAIGFTMVFPLTRPLYKLWLVKWVAKKMKDGSITFFRR
ncbi:FxsA family protein [Paenibacillus sp. J22TS3]|uniref:FxsA family protein n=1 Tax=Paenibacillus sp. J22TS3 TaxID=2807192 RepID=UPI001B200CDA|nr:FxsA family protein [Paenibacillus sp. J22TS3]GIP20936.1 membrane protein FxsA [Paenibacillus sp. J22TS3]